MLNKAHKYKDSIAVMEPSAKVLDRISTGLGNLTVEYAGTLAKQAKSMDTSKVYYTGVDEKIDGEYGVYDENFISSKGKGIKKGREGTGNLGGEEEIWETAQREAEDLTSMVPNGCVQTLC